jgi:hypothetical protein
VLKRGAATIVVEVVVGEGANDLIRFSADEAEPVPPPAAEEHVEETGEAVESNAAPLDEGGDPEPTA